MSNNGQPELATPAREQKHLQIDNCLERLRGSISGLERLADDICKRDSGGPEVAERIERSLSAVLTELPSDLGGEADRIDKAVAEIRELIF